MAFQQLKIAAGYDNEAGFVNLEDVTSGGWYFNPAEDLGKWSEGDEVIRGDGVVIPQGQESTSWMINSLSIPHWFYLYETILSGKFSGPVTISTRRYQADIYMSYNAVLTIAQPNALTKTNIWYEDVVLRFTRLRRIGGFSSGFSTGFDRYIE